MYQRYPGPVYTGRATEMEEYVCLGDLLERVKNTVSKRNPSAETTVRGDSGKHWLIRGTSKSVRIQLMKKITDTFKAVITVKCDSSEQQLKNENARSRKHFSILASRNWNCKKIRESKMYNIVVSDCFNVYHRYGNMKLCDSEPNQSSQNTNTNTLQIKSYLWMIRLQRHTYPYRNRPCDSQFWTHVYRTNVALF